MGVKAAFRVADRVVHTAHGGEAGGQGQKGPGAGQAESKQPWRGLCSLRDLAHQPWATGWEHSLTWAGSARRQAGSRAQNLPGVSDGRSASFQRPLIIQRNSLSVCVFPLPPPMPGRKEKTAETEKGANAGREQCWARVHRTLVLSLSLCGLKEHLSQKPNGVTDKGDLVVLG